MANLPRLAEVFCATLVQRAPIAATLNAAQTDCMRLFGGTSDGIKGWIVDKFGSTAWIQYRETECDLNWAQAEELGALCHANLQEWGVRTTFLKRYVPDRSRLPNLAQDGTQFEMVFGEPLAAYQTTENGALFRILPTENFSPGLFLDQRENRAWAREHARAKRVLNLFAYTGAFSVTAALGGAREVTTVDVSKKWLEIAKENFALNGISLDGHRFFATGAMSFLSVAEKKSETFDLILVDPPSFSRSERDGVFSLRDDRQSLWGLCAGRVAKGGTLFFSCNWQQMDQTQLQRETRALLPSLEWESTALPACPPDFEGSDNPIAAVAYRRKS